MVGVGPAGIGINHGFGVAVIGGDNPGGFVVAGFKRLVDTPETQVHRFHRFNGRFQIAGVTHHIRVGVIHDDGVEFVFLDGLYHRVGDAFGAHLGLQIVSGNFRRRNQYAFFTAKRLFDAAIEKVSDMRVFFGFSAAQVAQIHVGEDLRKDVLHFLRADDVAQPRPGFFILGHAHIEKIFGAFGVGDFIEARLSESFGDLASAVGTEVEEDDGIVVANEAARSSAVRFGDDDRLDEFVGGAAFVALAQRGGGFGGMLRRVAVDDCAISFLDSLPAIIAIHGEIAAGKRGNASNAIFADFLLEAADEIDSAVRRGVAAVHKAMDEDALDVILFGHAQQREKMFELRVDAAITDQADKVQLLFAAVLHGFK